MNYLDIEKAAIEKVSPKYESKGYKLLSLQNKVHYPKSIGSYRPDAVFEKDGKFLALEIKRREIQSISKQLDRLKELFIADPKWNFEVVYFDNLGIPVGPKKQTIDKIRSTILNIEKLAQNEDITGAFFLSWAAFEAVSRRLFPKSFEKPQSPGRLITVLAENGSITPFKAKRLRDQLTKRNSLIHGGLDTEVNKSEVLFMTKTISDLLEAKA